MTNNDRKVAYLAHPYGGDPRNLESAKRWLKWCFNNFSQLDFAAPWIPVCEVFDENMKERMLSFDAEMVERCDILFLVGGRISNGMQVEVERAIKCGKPIIDLTWMGPNPVFFF